MASPTDPLVRSKSGKSGSAVRREPFDHLIQHIKQEDVMLYEALKRLYALIQNLTEITTTGEDVDTDLEVEHKEIRAIIPDLQVVANDVMVNRYRVTIGENKKLVLTSAEATAKTTDPTSAAWICDIQRSRDKSSSFTSLFPDGIANKPTVPIGDHESSTTTFAIDTLFDGDEMRYDILSAGDAVDMEIVLVGDIVDI